MNEKVLKTLEYDKIIDQLAALAGSTLAKDKCKNLKPSSILSEIQAAQRETSDALSRLLRRGNISFSGVTDVRGTLKRLEIGSILSMEELLRICKLLEVCARVKSYSRKDAGEDTGDSLDDLFEALQPLTPVSSEIRRCIISEDEYTHSSPRW